MARVGQQFSELIMRQSIIRFQPDGLPQRLLGLIRAIVSQLRGSQMKPIASVVRLDGNGASQVGFRFPVFSLVDESDREQEQAPRGIRAALERLVKGAPSVVVAAFVVVTDRHTVIRFLPARRLRGRALKEFQRMILVSLKLLYAGGQEEILRLVGGHLQRSGGLRFSLGQMMLYEQRAAA